MKGGKYENIPSLVENLVEHAPVTISWLIGLGADLSDVGLMGGSSVKRTHRPQGGSAIGPHLMKVLNDATSSKNIEIRTSNKVLDLLSAVDGSVTGVKVQNADGSTYSLTAKAVIIATGGFGANLEMVTSLQPSLKGFATLNHPGATGDAFGWMTAIGGATIQMANIQIHPTAEAVNHILITEAVRGNGAILVNHESKRFCNEMDTRDVVSAAILAQTQGEAFLIFDQGVRESLASIETYANQHLLKEGATVAELAEAIGIPAADLEATLTRYNAQQKAGVDEDFGRSATQMTAALETAPYYAVCVTPAIHHTMGGLSVNTDTQVLKADGTPIPGLYAAGVGFSLILSRHPVSLFVRRMLILAVIGFCHLMFIWSGDILLLYAVSVVPMALGYVTAMCLWYQRRPSGILFMEWVWRMLTYGRYFQFKVTKEV